MLRKILILLLFLVIALGAAVGYEYWRYDHQQVMVENTVLKFEVPKGATAGVLVSRLADAGLHVEPLRMRAAWRLRGDSARVKAGTYEITGPQTLKGVLDQLVEGQPIPEGVFKIVDGWNMRQVRDALARTSGLVNDVAKLSDAQLAERLKIPGGSVEGWFAPDSYAFSMGGSDLDVLQRAYRLQQKRLEAAWSAKLDNLKLGTPYDLLTLASVVEKETGVADDRSKVSAVFNNRLRIGMMLQSDPTVIYGIGPSFDGNLRRKDLRADTPYNSYTRTGLPPTPISMPGQAALEAAARPAAVKSLYFVSRGDGSSEFSETLDAHNKAVNRHQRGRP